MSRRVSGPRRRRSSSCRCSSATTRPRFEFHCYSEQDADDDITARIRSRAAGWTDTRALGDEELAQAIRRDTIDVLVDLAGHTPGNRLRALSRKPAPIVLTWLDYFDTTGCEAFDALVTDPLHSPPGDGQRFVERRLRLEPLRFCYGPPEDAPDVVSLPSRRAAPSPSAHSTASRRSARR